MRAIPAPLQNRLNASPLQICRLYDFTTADGTIHRFTDHDGSLTVDGELYRTSSAISIQAIETTTGETAVNTALTLNYIDGLTKENALNGVYDGATILVSLISYAEPDAGRFIFANLILQQQSADDKAKGQWQAKGIMSRVDGFIGEIYSKLCRAQLGDARCKVDLGPFTLEDIEVFNVVSANVVFEVSISGNKPERWFQFGSATFAGQHYSIEIMASEPQGGDIHRITLSLPTFHEILIGDLVTLVAGCDKELDTCLTKFNNILNRRAEDFAAGSDDLTQPSM